MINFLVTAAGSPGFINVKKSLSACKPELDNYLIHGCDINADAIGLQLADKSFITPTGDSDQYISEVYCKNNNIDLIIPCADEELIPLSKNKSLFADIGCKILTSSTKSLETTLNKAKLFNFCRTHNMQHLVVDHYMCNNIIELRTAYDKLSSLGHQVCVKPVLAHGSRGFRVIKPPITREDFFNKKPKSHEITIDVLCEILGENEFPDLLVMEYLPGREYSVDCYKRQDQFLCVPRTREIIKDGLCIVGTTVKNDKLIKTSKYIYDSLGLSYNANVQFRYDSSGNPKILEVNPRFSGTMELCRAAGINFVEVAVNDVLSLQNKKYDVKWGIKMTRIWNEIFQNDCQLWTHNEVYL